MYCYIVVVTFFVNDFSFDMDLYCHGIVVFIHSYGAGTVYRNVMHGRSFTIVVDTTNSMREELAAMKASMGGLINKLGDSTEFDNFILVPFNDMDGAPLPPLTFSTLRNLADSIFSLKAVGGEDCPENSMAGIEKALELSNPMSLIFVFTDAYAKDNTKLRSIGELCRHKQSQVMIFLSGDCVQSGSIEVYYDIAKHCSGTVLRFDSSDFRQAFTYMTDIAPINWNYNSIQEEFYNRKDFDVSVDSFTKSLVITIIGENASLRVSDENGQNVPFERIIHTRKIYIIFINVEARKYTINISCQGIGHVKYSLSKEFLFRFGFSTKLPQNLLATSPRPLPGLISYIVLHVPETFINLDLRTVEIVLFDGSSPKNLPLNKLSEDFYYAKSKFEDNKPFKLLVKGFDEGNGDFAVTSDIVEPQFLNPEPENVAPVAHIDSEVLDLLEYGSNITLTCKVSGYPKADIWWEDESNHKYVSEDVLLQLPATYVSYVYLDNLTENKTIYCKANNTEGETSAFIEIKVKNILVFEVLQTPEDTTIEYGKDGTIGCEVNAYPPADIKWYHNNTLIKDQEDYEIETNGLYISNMDFDKAGAYKCEVQNENNKSTFIADISISGVEMPAVSVEKSEFVAKPNEKFEIACRITSGRPYPTITWTFKKSESFDYDNIPSGVVLNETGLIIQKLNTESKGTYKCEACNVIGCDYREVIVKIHYAPIIKSSSNEKKTVKEGDMVELLCEVDADPKANVYWEMYQDDVIVALDKDKHTTDPNNTHRFKALWNDSGDYHCIADNEVGRSEVTVSVNVLVPPYIEPPSQKSLNVRKGDAIDLSCNVLYSNPAPTMTWEFISLYLRTSILSRCTAMRGNSTCHLHIENVDTTNEGEYMCSAANFVNTDSIKIKVTVS